MSAPAPSAGLEGLGRRLVFPLALALLVLAGLALVADARQLARYLRAFDLRLLVPILALSLLNYGLRLARWERYLRVSEVRLRRSDSVGIFLVGFLLSITPGKAGELGKAWLTRELGGGKARRAVAVVLAERLTDVLGMLLLTAAGAWALAGGAWIAAGCLALAAALTGLLAWSRVAHRILAVAERLPRVGSLAHLLEEVYDRFRSLLMPRHLLPALILSVLAWGAEGLGLGIVLRHYRAGASWLGAVFDYSASTLFGAVSMLPGGLVASEGALTALLGWQGLETAAAASATLVIRAATLWFAVGLGLLALPFVLRRLRVVQGSDQGSGAG